MINAIFVFLIFFMMIVGFILGKFSERASWNSLIEEGKIPRPSKKLGKIVIDDKFFV